MKFIPKRFKTVLPGILPVSSAIQISFAQTTPRVFLLDGSKLADCFTAFRATLMCACFITRLAMLEKVVTNDILIPPKFALYPKVEEVLWRTVQRAIAGQMTITAALRYMREQIRQIVQPDGNGFRCIKENTRPAWETKLS